MTDNKPPQNPWVGVAFLALLVIAFLGTLLILRTT